MGDDRFVSERYDENNNDGDGIIIRSHKRDIGDNTFMFVHVNNKGHSTTLVSRMEFVRVHKIHRERNPRPN